MRHLEHCSNHSMSESEQTECDLRIEAIALLWMGLGVFQGMSTSMSLFSSHPSTALVRVAKLLYDDCTERILVHSYLPGGEGNGTPLQYSCLENPMDVGAW